MDFTQIVKSTAQEQLESKNWHGYMQLNTLADFFEKTHNKVKNQPDSQTEDVTTTERTKETAVHTPFDKFDGQKHAPYWELADESGVIAYKGTVFVCDDEHAALCLGDMSDESNVLSIPLAGGGTLKVNRNNKADLARAMVCLSRKMSAELWLPLRRTIKFRKWKMKSRTKKTASEPDRRTKKSRSKRVLSLRLGYVKIKK